MNVQEKHVMQIPAIIAVNGSKDKLSFEGVDMRPNVWYHISPSIKEYLNSYLKY